MADRGSFAGYAAARNRQERKRQLPKSFPCSVDPRDISADTRASVPGTDNWNAGTTKKTMAKKTHRVISAKNKKRRPSSCVMSRTQKCVRSKKNLTCSPRRLRCLHKHGREGLLLRSRACAGLLFAIASSNPHKTNIAKNLSLVHPYVSRTISFHLPLTKAGGVTRPLTKAGGVTRAVKRKKEHRQPKGGMGGRHAAKGF